MSMFYQPRPLTEDEINIVTTISLTGPSHTMLEYDEQYKKIEDGCGAVVYATTCGKFIQISEIGYVSVQDTLEDALLTM